MRRSFKVATVFTGTAALAGGFGPTALAATAQPAAVHPDYTAKECGANNDGVSHWVHLYYPNDDHPAECLGGKTTNHAVNATVASFCPGNNYGHFSGSVNGIKYADVGFNASSPRGPIYGYQEFHITQITISGDRGVATCT
jgi:hypothetical protein